MQLRKKSEFSLDSLPNDSNSPPDFPVLDSPSTSEDSKNLLPDRYSSQHIDLSLPNLPGDKIPKQYGISEGVPIRYLEQITYPFKRSLKNAK
ncbi:hypothetical protein H6F96_23200 [Microcoleus sp. FACHB-53]|nr:hypothetical protein [Microcoleus sp. FACHB-53]